MWPNQPRAAVPPARQRRNPRRLTAPAAFTRTLTQVWYGVVMACPLGHRSTQINADQFLWGSVPSAVIASYPCSSVFICGGLLLDQELRRVYQAPVNVFEGLAAFADLADVAHAGAQLLNR